MPLQPSAVLSAGEIIHELAETSRAGIEVIIGRPAFDFFSMLPTNFGDIVKSHSNASILDAHSIPNAADLVEEQATEAQTVTPEDSSKEDTSIQLSLRSKLRKARVENVGLLARVLAFERRASKGNQAIESLTLANSALHEQLSATQASLDHHIRAKSLALLDTHALTATMPTTSPL